MSDERIARVTLQMPPEAWCNVDVPNKKIEFCVPATHDDARRLVDELYAAALVIMNQIEPVTAIEPMMRYRLTDGR